MEWKAVTSTHAWLNCDHRSLIHLAVLSCKSDKMGEKKLSLLISNKDGDSHQRIRGNPSVSMKLQHDRATSRIRRKDDLRFGDVRCRRLVPCTDKRDCRLWRWQENRCGLALIRWRIKIPLPSAWQGVQTAHGKSLFPFHEVVEHDINVFLLTAACWRSQESLISPLRYLWLYQPARSGMQVLVGELYPKVFYYTFSYRRMYLSFNTLLFAKLHKDIYILRLLSVCLDFIIILNLVLLKHKVPSPWRDTCFVGWWQIQYFNTHKVIVMD